MRTKDFKIVKLLGKGTYGAVYKVIRKSDNEEYALKEVSLKALKPREREDAVNEVRVLASIKHRNILRYCEAFLEGSNLYIVTEYAKGVICMARSSATRPSESHSLKRPCGPTFFNFVPDSRLSIKLISCIVI